MADLNQELIKSGYKYDDMFGWQKKISGEVTIIIGSFPDNEWGVRLLVDGITLNTSATNRNHLKQLEKLFEGQEVDLDR